MTQSVRQSWIWRVAAALIAAFVLYWGLLAPDRYVSEAQVLIENLRTPKAATPEIATFFTGGGNAKESLQLREYLLSADMLRSLDAKLDLRTHFSDSYDLFSRMWSKTTPFERFLRHYRQRVGVDYNEHAGVLVIHAQAYAPQMAHAIATTLVGEGERFMNELARRLAQEQVEFAEKETARAAKRVMESRQALLAYQNKQGIPSPRASMESISAVVARLEGELSAHQARRRVLEGYLAPGAPDLVQANAQVKALEQQLEAERARLASPKGKALNIVAEQYERMLFETEFAEQVYRTALAALEQSRIDAARKLRLVSVLQAPTVPEYPLEPRRVYNATIYVLTTLLIAGILHLLLVIIREHRE
jgi:capsular polysaccharide transport system permease protein